MTEEFKILINNEEVVSNSNLQIKEEMLSTSSTILKNCYPKAWETTKDYTTNYYFPKDYSKCKIINEKSYPEQPGTRVSGTNLNINYNNTLNWDLEQLQGDTLQTGTPTPTSPQAVQTVTGLQNINVCGKNLFDKNNANIVNTNVNATNMTSFENARTLYIPINGGETYTISKTLGARFRVATTINTPANGVSTSGFISDDSATSITIETSNTAKYIVVYYYLVGTDTLTEQQILNSIQIEKGQATTYEAYTGQSYEVNLGKNLLNIPNGTYSKNGLDVSVSNQKLTIDGTTSANASINITSGFKISTPGTYTVSATPDLSSYGNNLQIGAYVYYANGSYKTNIDIRNANKTQTISNGEYIGDFWVYVPNGNTIDNLEVNVQLEKGSVITTYSEYFTPIELCKIGNYQDYIRKSTGKNLFDKDNANIINGYINGTTGVITSDTNARSIYMPCKPNTTYTIQKIVTTRFRVSYSSSLPEIGTETSGIISNYDGTSITITTGNNASYLIAWVCQVDTTTLQDVLDSIQIEEGNQATSYEPYGKVWYIEKNIGKVDFSTLTWDSAGHQASGYRRYYTNTIPNVKYVSSNTQLGVGLAEKYKIHTGTGMGSYGAENCFAIDVSIVQAVDTQSPSGLFYYAMATPTTTEITNTELIEQLESIELINGINNISITSADLPGAIQILYNYKEAYTEEDLLFCGCVKNTGNISLNPREPHYVDLQILDFKTLLSEGETLNYVITGKTITEAINQVVASISDYGFVVGNIQILNPDDIINAYSTLNKTAYDVFQYIADITQSRWTTRVIDENTIAIDFYDPTLMPQADPILNTHEYLCNNKIDDISFNYSTNDYRNKQIMTSDEVFANITQTETLIADGYRDSFMCQNKIGVIGKITVNGVEKTFATKSQVELGVTADFVYIPGNMTFDSSITYSAGAVIVITYYPIVKGREIILNSTESTRISNQIGRKGTISRYENRNDTTSSQELIKIGQSYIKYKGSSQITLKIVSENDLFNVGQIVNYNAPIEELDRDYMVKSKTIDMYLNAGKTFYTYELSSSFNSENAINYFDNQRAKSQGNIGEGETITRNIDLESTALIQFYDTDIQEVEVSNPTSLDFGLDGVLI